MSNSKAKDSDPTYSVVDEVTGFGSPYEVPVKSAPNPAYGYTTSDKTAAKKGNPERLFPDEQPGSVSSGHAGTKEDREKANALLLKNRVASPTYLIALVVAVVLLIAAGIAIIIALVEISKLRFELAVLQSALPRQATAIQVLQNATDLQFGDVRNELNNSEQKRKGNLENIFNSISTQQSDIGLLSSRVNNNTQITEILATILYEEHVFSSCAAIQQFIPFQPSSGYYNIRSSNGSAITAYCDMTRSCGNITGGWMRVAELDMTDTTTQCPDSLELRTSPLRTCRIRNSGTAICSSDMFSVDGVPYSKVCGRIRAYQVGTTNAFAVRSMNIDSYYVDGVSITHGSSPRQHIWTFASALNEDEQYPDSKCPCTNTIISDMVPPPPQFVGNDYFCDTAIDTGIPGGVFYNDDPLWDGAGCGPQSTCCSFNSPLWFYKQLPQTTTDDIEMRVCRDQERANEDIAVEIVELYVQ